MTAAAAPSRVPSTSYDRLPVDGKPLPATHPDALAVTALLAGLTPAPVATARVLEVGCGVGGNLMPMAQAFPEGTFVGIDTSGVQIAEARRVASGAGLTNVRFDQIDLTALPPDFGEFDFIIAHGVYSWVPQTTRERLLDLLAAHLAPDGVAYVNYHVSPGWHVRQMFRDMILTQVRGISDLKAMLTAARRVIGDTAAMAALQGDSAYGHMLANEARFLDRASDEYLLHEFLEASPQAPYFRQFVEQLEARGLAFVSDVKLSPARLKVVDELKAANRWGPADWLRWEQAADFIQGNFVRRSVVARASAVPADRVAPADAIERLFARSSAVPQGAVGDLRGQEPLPLRLRDGSVIQIAEPLAKLTLAAIARAWPATTGFDRILDVLRNDYQLGAGFASPDTNERAALRQVLTAAYTAGLIDLHADEAAWGTYTPQPPERPLATPLARFQAREFPVATNLLHYSVPSLNTVDRLILAHANGERDRAAFAAVLRAALSRGLIPDPNQDPNAAYNAGWADSAEASADVAVQKLAANGFFQR